MEGPDGGGSYLFSLPSKILRSNVSWPGTLRTTEQNFSPQAGRIKCCQQDSLKYLNAIVTLLYASEGNHTKAVQDFILQLYRVFVLLLII